jgi:hypothetical protein
VIYKLSQDAGNLPPIYTALQPREARGRHIVRTVSSCHFSDVTYRQCIRRRILCRIKCHVCLFLECRLRILDWGLFLGSDSPCFLQLSHLEVRTLPQTRFSHRTGGKRPCAIRRAQLMQRREYYKTKRAEWKYIIVTSVCLSVCLSLSTRLQVFRRVRETAEGDCYHHHVCPSVRLHATTRPPLDGIS